MKIFYQITPVFILLFCLSCGGGQLAKTGEPACIGVSDWQSHFQYQYDYTVKETSGLDRDAEPVTVTLSAKAREVSDWQKEVRVLRVCPCGKEQPVPFQVYGVVAAQKPLTEDIRSESANVVFLASCPANETVTYRLLWCKKDSAELPTAALERPVEVYGAAPGINVKNRYYSIMLSPKCGAMISARRMAQSPDKIIDFYQNIPIHFVADIWSPPERWDHDYDWDTPPHQELIQGPLMVKYTRWGPMSLYKDVMVYLTYTFYADVPYVEVTSMMEFTENRAARAVRMGEIVTTHLETPDREAKRKQPLVPVFTHYAWPEGESMAVCDIAAHLNENHEAEMPGLEKGALAILDRDVPWVAAYHAGNEYGMASLRKSHFTMNKLGGPVPYTVPCTYLGQYGWGFTYWSRPEVYPFGARQTPLDRNTVVATGTVFGNEEALLLFDPQDDLNEVKEYYTRFLNPLKLQFKGTGPW
ncbi:MAG TPA: hypothetical protein PLQ35_06465 [bacterium]|nr:hypothetical protein [bacterium]HQL61919.1 hypothetical protein [bacterium]